MLIAMLLSVGLVGTGCAAIARQVVVEVALLGINYLGEQIFSGESGLGDDEAGITDSSDGGRSSGDAIGLYGGTAHRASCDRNKLIRFLERPENVDQAEAWAQVLGIATSAIRGYVRGLTPFVLRRDTLVKNHGFKKVDGKGRSTVFHALLEAGVAVLVDQFGSPKVRCECGNPLLSPDADVRSSKIEYKGTRWNGFRENRTTVVQAGNKVDTFTFQDGNGQYVRRNSGDDGTNDNPGPTTGPAPHPRLVLSSSRVAIGGTYTATATGFAPGEQVRFSWTGVSSGTIGTFTADSQGRASIDVREGASPGQYMIKASGLSSGRAASAPLEVVQA
jgi:hypothetical protein